MSKVDVYQKPCFTTDRLDVFKASCERGREFYSVNVYLAFQRDAGDGIKWPMVICTMLDGCVEFIESSFAPRSGYALELLLGLSTHLNATTPLEGQTYTPEGKRLFAAYRKNFLGPSQSL